MQFLLIVGLSILAATSYGVIHDQLTARICIEYFTIGHPRIIDSTSPTVLGIVWGVVATWWVGLLLGLPLAFAARVGSWPKMTARNLIRPIFRLQMFVAIGAFLSGLAGWYMAASGHVSLPGELAIAVPQPSHIRFLVDWFTHLASYLFGFLGGIVVIVLTAVQRCNLARKTPPIYR